VLFGILGFLFLITVIVVLALPTTMTGPRAPLA